MELQTLPHSRTSIVAPSTKTPSPHDSREQIAGASTEIASSSAPLDITDRSTSIFRERVQYSALCVYMFLSGWNDGTTGPLLTRIQAVYDVNFLVVSLLFVAACIGYISGALLNVYISETLRINFGKILVGAAILQILAYALIAPALPFPAMAIAYGINGVGMAIQHAQANGYVSGLRNTETKMGFFHAYYGLGAFGAPLVATQFAELPHWSYFYLVSLGIAVIDMLVLLAVFQLKSKDESLAYIGLDPLIRGTSTRSPFSQIFSQKIVHVLAAFIFVYVGTEVTIGGWIVTYIIRLRGGGPSSGYISAGFFGGLMAGRVLLLWVNQKLGERTAVFLYVLLAIGLQLVVWLVPSLVGGGVAVSLVGLFFGPMYPIALNIAGRIIPKYLVTSSIGWVAGVGMAGSAALPFLTGAIANSKGIESLQPLLIAMMALLVPLWFFIAREKRAD